MGEFDTTFGALCIGYVIAWGLFGVMSMQTFIYFQKFEKDKLWLKLLVIGLWILDTLQIITMGHSLYYWLITNYNNPAALVDSTWSFNIGVLFTNSIVLTVECFLARRVYIMSGGNRWLSGIIVILSFSYYGFELATLVRTFQIVKVTNFYKFEWIASTGLGCAVVADLTIAISLCLYLNRSRTGIKTTDSIINKLLLYAMNTGLLTAIFVLIDMICFVTMPNNLIHLAFNIVSGKMYTNSLLATLNFRDTIRGTMQLKGANTTFALSALNTTGTTRSAVAFKPHTTQATDATTFNGSDMTRSIKETEQLAGVIDIDRREKYIPGDAV